MLQTYPEHRINIIDTPGHVDFSYEVSRSLSACEGALLVVDASQGVEAQTVANCNTAMELGLAVIPVINKIDLLADIGHFNQVQCKHLPDRELTMLLFRHRGKVLRACIRLTRPGGLILGPD